MSVAASKSVDWDINKKCNAYITWLAVSGILVTSISYYYTGILVACISCRWFSVTSILVSGVLSLVFYYQLF